MTAGNVAAKRWESLTPADRWERSTPTEMLEMSLHVERGPMVIDDVRALPLSPLIVAEGSTLPASVIASGAAEPSRALWMLPTVEFQDAALAKSGTTGGQATLARLLRQEIECEAGEHNVPTLTVDGSMGVSAIVEVIELVFGDALAQGPRAETVDERRRLLPEMNEALAALVRGYYARPWAQGDPDLVRRSYVCEWGDSACDVDLDLTVPDVSARLAIAPGHHLSA